MQDFKINLLNCYNFLACYGVGVGLIQWKYCIRDVGRKVSIIYHVVGYVLFCTICVKFCRLAEFGSIP